MTITTTGAGHRAGARDGSDQVKRKHAMMIAQFEVSAKWMRACGKGDAAKVFDIIGTDDYSLKTRSAFFGRMITVNDNGHPWVVAIGRGKLVEAATYEAHE